MSAPARLVAVVGPTGSGKSDLAVGLGHRLAPAEIVNADSMQLYRGMDIGTAKPTVGERGGVPHHLFDALDIDETASVAEFQRLARAAIEDCHARGVLPIVVGGSALYVRAIVDRLEFPGTDAGVRAGWERRLTAEGPAALHAELARRDPAAAARILPTNGRRLVRALEVVELTGKPFEAAMPAYESVYPGLVLIGLDVPREELDERLAARVRRMWEAGFVDEVRALAAIGLDDSPTASRALGYRQVLAMLRGELDEGTAIEETVAATRRFARRQDRLFRKDPRITWIRYDLADRADVAAALVRAAG